MPRRRRTAADRASFKGMGLAVMELRENLKLTKLEIADRAGIHETLRRLEAGKIEAHWGTLRRLAKALETPLDALIELAEERAPGVGREARRRRSEGSDPATKK